MKKEYILCSAIYFDDGKEHDHQPKNITTGYVICGRRHHNCFATAYTLDPEITYLKFEKEQGFLTNLDRFVDRNEGLKIALEAEQVLDVTKLGKQLFSEDLY